MEQEDINVSGIPLIDQQIEDIKKVEEKTYDELWDEIGFHKPLAGFWFKIAFYIFDIIIGLVLVGVWYRYLYPYPESMGYRSAATGIFSLFFTIFDLGTHMTMDRYIAEARIKNPKKMIQYIQYFIWYQMFTGLIQTTAVSCYALFLVPRTELAYAVWIMVLYSTTQYPGFLGVFRGVLKSLQHFDKIEILNFVTSEFFQKVTEILFVLAFRQYGINHPEIGEIMGIAIGATIGLYIDDFFATILSAYYFQKIMAREGIKVKDCFRIDFDMNLVKETLLFGVKTGLPTIIGLATELLLLWEWLTYVPQYTTFVSLAAMAGSVSGLINKAHGIELTMLISESYLNDKKELTQYYVGQTFRFSGQTQAFLMVVILIMLGVLPDVYPVLGMSNYLLAIPFIIPKVLRDLQQPYTTLADNLCLGTNHPTWLMFIRLIEEITKIFWMTLWIIWLQFPERFGVTAIVWIMPCGIYPSIIMKTILSYIFIHKTTLKIQIPWWQSFGAPIISCLIVYSIGLVAKITVFNYFKSIGQIYVGMICLIVIGVLAVGFLYYPLTVFLGGWDDDNLRQFKKAAKMSGPSKFIVMLIYNLTEWASKHSKLHNRFGMSSEIAYKQAAELLALKHANDIKTDESE